MSSKDLLKVRKAWLLDPSTKVHQPKKQKDISINDLRKFQGSAKDLTDEDFDPDFDAEEEEWENELSNELAPTEEELREEQEALEKFNNKLSKKENGDILDNEHNYQEEADYILDDEANLRAEDLIAKEKDEDNCAKEIMEEDNL